MTSTTALHVPNGVRVIVPTANGLAYGLVGSAHYHGPIDGSGTITFCLVNGRDVTVPASTPCDWTD
jgi:hypothetical protein